MGMLAGRTREATLVCLFFALLTLVLAAPLSLSPATHALPLSADTRLFLWTISWDVEALLHHPLSLFDANIFFPEPRTLAYSEHILGSAVLGAPALLATGNPVLALNVIVLLSCVLCGLGAYVLARELGASVPAALAAGVIFAFGPPRFVRLAQVHLATVQWIPFGLAFFHRYARGARRADLLAAAAFFTLQSLTSGHGGLFMALALGALVLYLWAFGRLPGVRRMLGDLGVAGALILGVNVVFLVPYLRAQHDVGLHRTLGAVYDWAPNAVSFLAAPTHAQQWLLSLVPGLREKVEGARAYLFPGWITLVLAAVAVFARRKAGATETTAEAPSPSPSPWWLKALDAALVLVAVVALTIRVSDGIDWKIGSLNLTARTAGRAFVLLGILAAVRLLLARLRPFAFAPALRQVRDAFRRTVEGRVGLDAGFYVVLAVLSLWACLGPGYVLYTTLYRLLPGFDLIRVPSRLFILTLLALAVLAAKGLDRLIAPLAERRRAAAGATVVVLLTAELAAFPLETRPYTLDLPAIDRELAARPRPFTVVELPVADPANATQSARLHSHYMLHSMAHWQPMVNGYSGIIPPRHERLFRILTAFPDTASLHELESLGVTLRRRPPRVLHRGGVGALPGTGRGLPGPPPPGGGDERRPALRSRRLPAAPLTPPLAPDPAWNPPATPCLPTSSRTPRRRWPKPSRGSRSSTSRPRAPARAACRRPSDRTSWRAGSRSLFRGPAARSTTSSSGCAGT